MLSKQSSIIKFDGSQYLHLRVICIALTHSVNNRELHV